MLKNAALLSAVIATVAIAGPARASTNLIVNGDFSSPTYSGNWGTLTVPGWSNLSDPNGVELGYTPLYGLPIINAGDQNLEVNAYTFGDVVQTVTGLTAGDKYNLSWEYGGRPGGGAQQLDVSFGGALIAVDSGSIGKWTLNTATITATSGTEVLEFKSVDVGGLASYGNEVDNVLLSAVPETSTWAMMLLGFAGLGFAAHIRRNRKDDSPFRPA